MQAIPRARSCDPLSSHIAAAESHRFSASHAQLIMDCFNDLGAGDGLCAPAIARLTGLTVVQVDRRLPELQRAGLIRVGQVDGKDWMSGRYRVWEAV